MTRLNFALTVPTTRDAMRTRSEHFDVTRAVGALLVEECDIPVGMTVAEWRAARAAADRERRPARRDLRVAVRRALQRG